MSYPKIVGDKFWIDAFNAIPAAQAMAEGRITESMLTTLIDDRLIARSFDPRFDFRQQAMQPTTVPQWWSHLTPWLGK